MTARSVDQPLRLPGGAALAAGEAPLVGHAFMYSTVAFYLHTEIVLTNRRLYAARPTTLFGLLPIGTRRAAYPIESIAGVAAATQFNILGFLVGALALLVGIAGLSSPGNGALGALLLVLGVLLMLGAPMQAIEVMNSGGGTIRFPVSVFERSQTVGFANRVSQAMAHQTRNGEPAAQGHSDAPSTDAGAALRNLTELRDQGLVTPEEFAAKRAEIIGRL